MSDGSADYTLTAQELAVAKDRLEALENPVVVKILLTKNPLSVHFRRFTDDLAAVSEKFQPFYMTSSDNGPPTIELKANLRYLAIPGGKELAPFLQSLISYSERKAMLSKRSLSALETFMTPTRFEVMISPACPHCPLVVGLVNQLALASTYLEVSIIDITLFDDFVGRYSVRAVPTVIIDGQDKLAGNVSEEVLVDRLANQTPATFHPDTFKKIVKEGDARRLAGMMVADGVLYSGALPLLADPDWSVRMGMMVVLEEVAERQPVLAQGAYPLLLELLDRKEANIRGDAAYLLGTIGNTSVLAPLERLSQDADLEVAEAAREAVEQIREREAPGK